MKSPCRTCRYDADRRTCCETCIALREYRSWLDSRGMSCEKREQMERIHALAWCVLRPLLRTARP